MKTKPTQADLDAANVEIKHLMGQMSTLRTMQWESEAREKRTEEKFADLKERLANAESVNAEMRGYLKRVQEDDVVREELVAVGDPEGERRLVPKRKSTLFEAASPYRDFADTSDRYGGMHITAEERRRNTKHWVTY